ncbi:MAG: DUF4249 domain-containing protein [Prolixibacteraceae bacterium]|nr:DUF4249 domain-containing protein [Prolixibacteraceae bacterium]
MKTVKHIILLVLTVVLFFSCLEEMEVDEELLHSKIAVITFLTPERTIYVKLRHNIPITQEDIEYNEIPDAEVSLYEDNVKIEDFEKHYSIPYSWDFETNIRKETTDTSFYFISEKYPKAGKTYRMEIKSDTYGDVSCETTIPAFIESITLNTEFIEEVNDSYTYTGANFKLNFTDPADEENYYRVVLIETRGQKSYYAEDSVSETIRVSNSFYGNYFNSNDPVFSYEKDNANQLVLGEISNNFGIFTDESINGEDCELSFFTYIDRIDTTIGEFIQYEVLLQSITKDMYYYLKSIDLQEIIFPFAEPVPIYSNVESGIGIFGSYSSTSVLSPSYGQYPKEGIKYDDQTFPGYIGQPIYH